MICVNMFKLVDDESEAYDWPESSLGQRISALEESLLCPICCGHYNNPQVLNCGHSYCSICIRKHFDKTLNRTNSDVCPSCREKADSADLKVNRVLAATVNCFKLMRKDLFDFINTQHANNTDDDEVVDVTDRRSQRKSTDSKVSPTVITQRIPHYSLHGMTRDKVKKTIETITQASRIKLRLDGDKDVLERRLREVIHLNNAQLNALQPLSFDQVIKYVNDRENAKEAEAKKSAGTINKLEKLKNGQTVKELDDNFAKLAKKASDLKEARRVNLQTKNEEEEKEGEQASSSSSSSVSLPPGLNAESLNSKEVTDLLARPYNWGPWRVVMSNRLGRPFFFNTVTEIGQFLIPPELCVQLHPTPPAEHESSGCLDDTMESDAAKDVSEGTDEGKRMSMKGEDEEKEEEDTFQQSFSRDNSILFAPPTLLSEVSTLVDTSIAYTHNGNSTQDVVDVDILFPESITPVVVQPLKKTRTLKHKAEPSHSVDQSQTSVVSSTSTSRSRSGRSVSNSNSSQRIGLTQIGVFDMTASSSDQMSVEKGETQLDYIPTALSAETESQNNMSNLKSATQSDVTQDMTSRTKRGKGTKIDNDSVVYTDPSVPIVENTVAAPHNATAIETAVDNTWSCETCTYANESTRSSCEMCGTVNIHIVGSIANTKPKRTIHTQMTQNAAMTGNKTNRTQTAEKGKNGATNKKAKKY